jgi:hypothetical protein
MTFREQGELVAAICRVGLPFGSKRVGLVAMLEAYIDDSGTDGGRPFTTLAGYVTTAARWGTFTERWCACLSRWHLGEWKTTDWLVRRRDYDGWGDEDCKQAFMEFAQVTDDYARFGVSMSVRPDQYRTEIIPYLKRRRHVMSDPAMWCLQAMLESFVSNQEWLRRADEQIAIIVDDYKRPGVTLDMFHEARAMLGVPHLFPSLTFASSRTVQPLQAADMLASVSRRASERLVIDHDRDEGWELRRLSKDIPLRVGHYDAAALARIRERVLAMDTPQITFRGAPE